jgi:hypothetical protein
MIMVNAFEIAQTKFLPTKTTTTARQVLIKPLYTMATNAIVPAVPEEKFTFVIKCDGVIEELKRNRILAGRAPRPSSQPVLL